MPSRKSRSLGETMSHLRRNILLSTALSGCWIGRARFDSYFIDNSFLTKSRRERLHMSHKSIIRVMAILSLGFLIPSEVLSQTGMPPPPKRPQIDTNGVDVQTGNVFYERKELSIGPEGNMGIYLNRTFSGGALRDNFSNLYTEIYDYIYGSTYSMSPFFGDYSDDSSGMFSPNGGIIDGTNYTTPEGIEIKFNKLILQQWSDPLYYGYWMAGSITYPNGVIWMIHYKQIQSPNINYFRIQSVTSNTGYQIKFEYETNTINQDYSNLSSWQRRTKAIAINNSYEYCNPDADSCLLSMDWPEVNYSYSSQSSTNSTIVNNYEGETQYTNYPAPNLGFGIREPGYTSDNLSYSMVYIKNPCNPAPPFCLSGSEFRVSSANVKGALTNYSYSKNDSTKQWTVVSSGPLSKINTYISTYPESGIKKWTDPLSRIHQYEYMGSDGIMTKATYPEGNYLSFVKKTSGAIISQTAYAKSGSGLPAISESRTYPPDCPSLSNMNMRICNQPLTITDPKGGVTTFTYSPVHGGVLTEVKPTVNGIQPVIRYSYTQRYAWIKNSAGAYVQAASPVWVRTEQRTCMATATVGTACAGGNSDEVVTTYDYGPDSGPNNLLLKGIAVTSGGATTRSCYLYDIYGNRIAETKPRANLTSCS